MKDLREAIREVLVNTIPCKYNCDGEPVTFEIGARELQILQAEYNIYFVEPDAEQLEVV